MYKVSVVTPFHNVDIGMFQKCADSMRGQTLGFENIEWIIVVHNSKPHYLPLLTEMFKNDKNVIIKELHDDFHSPASPRNQSDMAQPYLEKFRRMTPSKIHAPEVCIQEKQIDKILFTIY